MVTTLPILSDIVSAVVDRINTQTMADTEPFPTVFEFGPLSEVSKKVYGYDSKTVIVWLVEKGEDRKRGDLYGVSGNDIIIGLQTNDQWTMQDRMNANYKPKLLPVYELLVQELKAEKQLNNPYKIDHKKYNLYYWGGGAVNGTNSANLWEKMIDAILLENCVLSIKKNC
jgi:hypothetical protein